MKPVQFVAPEEAARANFYALLARLFYVPPDRDFLDVLAASGPLDAEAGELAAAWQELIAAAAKADAEAVRDEFDTVFVGTGKSPVTLYTTAYTLKHSNEAPLAALRGELIRLGLARRSEAHEPEDHIAALFDAMRFLVAEQQDSLEEQQRFFARWIGPAFDALCAAIERNDKTAFYRHVSRFTRRFLLVEQSAFEML
ncbi:MAG: TorD/DmsD family molecular chaperone [Betaproteobacteria bacterium]